MARLEWELEQDRCVSETEVHTLILEESGVGFEGGMEWALLL